MSQILDCKGLMCPEPVVRTKKLLASQPENLTVLVDNPASNENVCRLLSRSGYAVGSALAAGVWTIKAERCGCAMPENPVFTPAAGEGKTLLLITTETLGQGDSELGAKLMENFLATLPEMPDLWRIVLLNGGVKLAAASGKNLESLKALEAMGVSVLVCGACLTFFGLLEAKAVGETTNMLDVITSLSLAQKVIRP